MRGFKNVIEKFNEFTAKNRCSKKLLKAAALATEKVQDGIAGKNGCSQKTGQHRRHLIE